jgi:hypothetical protein
MIVKRITPVLFVAEVEPCAAFWTERLGFQKTVEVPEGSRLGFVALEKDGAQIMYQSYASLEKDVPAIASVARKGPTFLYIEVDNLDAIKAAIKGGRTLRTNVLAPANSSARASSSAAAVARATRLVIPNPADKRIAPSNGDRRRPINPAARSAGQKRLPGRAKWWPTAAE